MAGLPYINQIPGLIDKGVARNKRFLRMLWAAEFSPVRRWFDQLEEARRAPDPGMTLERFVRLMDKESYIILQIASPEPGELRYGAILYAGESRKHAFIETPYTPENFALLERHYKAAFSTRLQDEPIQDGLIEYYRWRRENYPNLSRFR